ncbi:MAG: zinc-binding dehydrogenase [Oscillospiraceae bacterium]
MKSAIYVGPGNIEVREVPMPDCDDDGVVVKNLCAAICGSDVFSYAHDGSSVRIFPGGEFGHEMVSEVVKVGKNVKDLKVGDRVYPFPLFAKNDMSRSASVGGFSEYVEFPKCQLNKSVFLVDDSISNVEASLIEPLTVGCHSAKLTNPAPGKTAIVFGAGMIGAAAAVTLKYFGVEKVMVTDVSDLRLEKVAALGFETCNVSKEDYEKKAKEYFGEFRGSFGHTTINADIYVDAVGINSNLEKYIEFGKYASIMSVVGVFHQPATADFMKLTYGQLHIVGSAGYDMSDVGTVMDILKSKKFDIESIVTHRFDLDNIDEALRTASDSSKSLKVVIQY